MLSKISRSIVSSIVALVVYVTLVVAFITLFEREQFLTFGTLWITFFIICTPAFLLFGIPSTYFIEKMNTRFSIQFVAHIFIGGLLSVVYASVLFHVTLETFWKFMIFGLLAGAVFFVVTTVFSKNIFKQSFNHAE